MPDLAQAAIDSEEECFIIEKKKKAKKAKTAKYERGYYKGNICKISFNENTIRIPFKLL